jgi:hypothetical protein
MKRILMPAVAALVLSSVAAYAAETPPKPVVSWSVERNVGISAGEVAKQLAESPELLAKVNAKLTAAGKTVTAWYAGDSPKMNALTKKSREAKKAGDTETYKKFRKEAEALKAAHIEAMGKVNAEILAMLPDDDARLQVKADVVFLTGKRDFDGLELTEKQLATVRALCTEAVKAKPEARSYLRPDMLSLNKKVVRESLTKALSPDQAVTLYKKLSEKDPKAWPPEKSPAPVE